MRGGRVIVACVVAGLVACVTALLTPVPAVHSGRTGHASVRVISEQQARAETAGGAPAAVTGAITVSVAEPPHPGTAADSGAAQSSIRTIVPVNPLGRVFMTLTATMTGLAALTYLAALVVSLRQRPRSSRAPSAPIVR